MVFLNFLFVSIMFFFFSFLFFPLQIRRKLLNLVGDDANAATVLGANFSAGFVAGSLAAGATCPLDVAKTRRQIEVFPLSQSVRI